MRLPVNCRELSNIPAQSESVSRCLVRQRSQCLARMDITLLSRSTQPICGIIAINHPMKTAVIDRRYRASTLLRNLEDLDQTNACAAVLSRDNGGVTARGKADRDGRFQRVRWGKTAGRNRRGLIRIVLPIVI